MNEKCVAALFLIMVSALVAPVNAEVVMDGSMGTAGPVAGPSYDIKAEYGQQAGRNLYHSFGTFNLATGDKAVFSGPDSVRNVISRVTGGQSSIDGRIVSAIANADFYFLNPAGFFFGPNAGLDIQGSFFAGTADYLRLGETDRFYGDPATTGDLSVESPTAFGFLYDTSSPITFEDGSLTVPNGESIALVGGDITVKGATLTAPEGNILLAATNSAGEATLGVSDIDVSSFNTLGTVMVSDSAKIKTSGDASGIIVVRGASFYLKNNSEIVSDTEDADGGSIVIRADTIELDNGNIYSDTLGMGSCGNIGISGALGGTAAELTMKNTSRIYSNTEQDDSTGNAGDISVSANRVAMSGNSIISSYTKGPGNAGAITMSAPESVSITDSQVFADSQGEGGAGDITISTRSFTLSGKGIVSTDTSGAGGSISIWGPGEAYADSIIVDGGRIFSGTFGSEDAGSVLIRSERISFVNGGEIGSESFDFGKGGSVTLESTGTIEFSGKDEDGGSRIFTTAKSTDENQGAGDITVTANRVVVRDGGIVAANTVGPGNAGILNIATGSLDLNSGGAISTATSDQGAAGDINLTAGTVRLVGGSVISSGSSSTANPAGDAGTVIIAATDSLTMENSSVTTQAENAGKGKISITAGNWNGMLNSRITTSIKKGGNDAGDITITPPQWVTMNHSFVNANAWEGKGGNIHIVGDHFISSVDSRVDASSALGIDGSVEIESPDVDAGSGLIVLPTAFYDASKWMDTPCAMRSGESASRFVMSGRDALPNKPYDISPQQLLWLEDE